MQLIVKDKACLVSTRSDARGLSLCLPILKKYYDMLSLYLPSFGGVGGGSLIVNHCSLFTVHCSLSLKALQKPHHRRSIRRR